MYSMRTQYFILPISILFLIISSTIDSQNLKKGFKYLEDKEYTEARTIFTSGENMNSCIGVYGEALILHAQPLKFSSGTSESSKKKKVIDKKLSAYFKINYSESKLKEVTEKELKSLKDYFSEERLLALKKEIESFFLALEDDELYLNLIKKLQEINGDSEFYSQMEIRYVEREFQKFKEKKYITSNEKLINQFPNSSLVPQIQRFIDSLRVSKATSIYSLSDIVEKYPENQFMEEVYAKIKKYNSDNVQKIRKKSADYQKIKVWKEFTTEKGAVDQLVDWNNYYRTYYKKSPKYYYLELTDYEMKKFALTKRYLIFEHSNYTSYDKPIKHIQDNRSSYPGSYVLDLDKGLKIISKEEVYKKGKLLDTYGAIYIKMTGKHRFSSDSVYQSMQEVIAELRSKYKHQLFTTYYSNGFQIYPYDNPFYFYLDPDELPECDEDKNAIYVYFMSSYKDTYLFEVYPDKIDEALERIEYKIGFYFRD